MHFIEGYLDANAEVEHKWTVDTHTIRTYYLDTHTI